MNNAPFLLSPAYKDYIWGGERIKKEYNKDTNCFPLAESWECSVHPDGESIVASGEFKGKTLKNVLDANPGFLGTHPDQAFGFPILIKLIDARESLSLQVHPNDEYAYQNENGERGKTEMWYVLDSNPGSTLIYGFSHNTDEAMLRSAIEKGTLERHLNKVKAEKDDVFLVHAGTVHSLGAGLLVAEIQESSNLTYRLYDYDRVDKNGRKRELHIDKALKVVDYSLSQPPRQPLRVLRYSRGVATEFLARCRYFEVSRMLVNTDRESVPYISFSSDSLSFRVLLCIEGEGKMTFGSASIEYVKGNCIFVPADSIEIHISGKSTFLDIRA